MGRPCSQLLDGRPFLFRFGLSKLYTVVGHCGNFSVEVIAGGGHNLQTKQQTPLHTMEKGEAREIFALRPFIWWATT